MFNHTAAIGADIGRHSLKIAVVKISGEIIDIKFYPLNQNQSMDYLIVKLLEAIREIRQIVSSEGINPICVGLANLIIIFAPEIIVLGGGMSEAHDSYFTMIKQSAFANSLENCRAGVKIKRAHLGSSGSLLGSGYYDMIRLAGKNI